MAERTGGAILADCLIAQGVTEIFGIPGVQLDAAVDALYERQEQIHFTGVRNEQAATYMADGYARSTGTVGVAMVVPGPGVLNALAGLATAYSTNSPVLLIAGQIDSQLIGKGTGVLHELPDQTGILERLTSFVGRAESADEIPDLVNQAFKVLRSDRPRPVALEVPPDVLAQLTAVDPLAEYVPPSRTPANPTQIAALADAIRMSSHPLIYAGGGIRASAASESLQALAELIEAPVLVTENGRGAIDARHRLAFDVLALRQFRETADLVIAVGTRFVGTFGGRMNVGSAKVALINVDAFHFGEPRQTDFSVQADAREALDALRVALKGMQRSSREVELTAVREWLDDQYVDIAPQREFLSIIREALPEDGVLVSEFTQVGYAASVCFPTFAPNRYIGPGYQGTLGYGFATALGAAIADVSRPVISLNGDGGFSWTLQELSTARRYSVPLVIVVFVDGFFGNVRRIQRDNYAGHVYATDLTNPDYQLLASAFGVASARVTGPDEFRAGLAKALQERGPFLLEVQVGEFPSPWHLIHEGLPRP